MFEIHVEPEHGIVAFRVEAPVDAPEMRAFADQLRAAAVSLVPGEIRVLADLRGLTGDATLYADLFVSLQRFGMRMGVRRVAELVATEALGRTLDDVARSSGIDRILRRFDDEPSARSWLLSRDP